MTLVTCWVIFHDWFSHQWVTSDFVHWWRKMTYIFAEICFWPWRWYLFRKCSVYILLCLVSASNWAPTGQFQTGRSWDMILWSLVGRLQMGKNSQNQGWKFGSWLLDLRWTQEHFCSLPVIISGRSGLRNLVFGGLGGLQRIFSVQAPFWSSFWQSQNNNKSWKIVLVAHVRADDHPPKLVTHDLGEVSAAPVHHGKHIGVWIGSKTGFLPLHFGSERSKMQGFGWWSTTQPHPVGL